MVTWIRLNSKTAPEAMTNQQIADSFFMLPPPAAGFEQWCETRGVIEFDEAEERAPLERVPTEEEKRQQNSAVVAGILALRPDMAQVAQKAG
jgi:hypothetical protein